VLTAVHVYLPASSRAVISSARLVVATAKVKLTIIHGSGLQTCKRMGQRSVTVDTARALALPAISARRSRAVSAVASSKSVFESAQTQELAATRRTAGDFCLYGCMTCPMTPSLA